MANSDQSESIDVRRIQKVSMRLKETSTTTILERMLPSTVKSDSLLSLSKYCEFTHEALLVFLSEDKVVDILRRIGYTVDNSLPSVIVRQRIADRYRLNEASLNLRWLHGTITGQDGRRKQIEVFFLPPDTPGLTEDLMASEQASEMEAHLAFEIAHPDMVVLRGVRETLIRDGGFAPDGGGVNLDEEPEAGGKTILYFAREAEDHDDLKRLVRFEVICSGNYAGVVREHSPKQLGRSKAGTRPLAIPVKEGTNYHDSPGNR